MPVTFDQLRKIYTHAPAERLQHYLDPLNAAMDEGRINTPERIAAFLAQIGHESMELRYMEEVWGPTATQLKYERPKGAPLATVKPFPLWQRLGNTEPNDSFRFRGSGPIQLTGRSNFRIAGKALGLDLENNPDLARTPAVGFRLAVWFWGSRGLNVLADQKTQFAFDGITLKINGGYNGKSERDAYWERAERVLGA
jgi:predicted chitinase